MIIVSLKIKKFFVSFIVLGSIALVFSFLQLPDNKFHIFFLNVGQGDSTFIKTPENHQIIVDGGPKSFVMQELADVMPFFDKTIDLVVLTHPHSDHISGLTEVLKRYKVSAVLMTGVYFEDPYYQEFLKEIREKNITIFIADNDTALVIGSVFLNVLSPFNSISGKSFANLNNSSIALKVIFKNEEILLMGDAEKDIEEALLTSGVDLDSDILKAGHHGSKTSSTLNFLNAVSPKSVVVSCGKDNSFGHPPPETLRNFYRANINNIYRTDLDGRIEFEF